MSVEMERLGSVTVITIDRPHARNAVDRDTADALESAFRAVDGDGTRAAVLTGAGGTFCAGADLQALADPDRRNRLERSDRAPMGPTRRPPGIPVIAAIEGHAVAGGLELALLCDLRMVAEDAVLGVFCRRVGVPLIDGGTVRLPRVVGHGVALDLILTGRAVDAEEALRIGLATRVVPTGDTRAAAIALAHDLAAFPHRTLRADLASTRAAFDRPLPDALLAEHDGGVGAIEAGGMTAGVDRFRAGAGRHGGAIDPGPAPT